MNTEDMENLVAAGKAQLEMLESLKRDFIATSTTLIAFAEAVAATHPDPHHLKKVWDKQISEVSSLAQLLFPGPTPTAAEAKDHIDVILRGRVKRG
ncbi:hypothetical protein [Stenotrophomonas sp. DR009]|uniref:hypothetical protein n=1 Tax=Stenotrophomonas sp. DR009 TaxID=3398461 RepID=UPI003BB0B65A